MKLESIVKTLGLPLGIVAVIVALLGLFGLDADQITGVAITLVGAQLCVTLSVNVLKWTGLISDGTSGKWSAVFNAAILVGVTVQMKFFPAFDLVGLDAQLGEFARVAGVVFLYVTQVAGSKAFYDLMARGFGVKAFTFSGSDA